MHCVTHLHQLVYCSFVNFLLCSDYYDSLKRDVGLYCYFVFDAIQLDWWVSKIDSASMLARIRKTLALGAIFVPPHQSLFRGPQRALHQKHTRGSQMHLLHRSQSHSRLTLTYLQYRCHIAKFYTIPNALSHIGSCISSVCLGQDTPHRSLQCFRRDCERRNFVRIFFHDSLHNAYPQSCQPLDSYPRSPRIQACLG